MVKKLFIALNIVALAVLLLSCAATYIEPAQYWQLAFVGFAFPLIVAANIVFLAGWALASSKWVLLPVIGLIISFKFIHATIALNTGPNQQSGIKLMTWNIKAFDLYNWSHNTDARNNMMELIKTQNPDVLCLQEFYSNSEVFHNLEYLRDTLGYKYCYFPPVVEITKVPYTKQQKAHWHNRPLIQKWGVATFSKFPVRDSGSVSFGKTLSNSCIYTDIVMNGKTVRLYNVHFQSIHLGYEDYAALDSIEDGQQTGWKPVKSIVKKMKRAYALRSLQVNAVAGSIASYNGGKIICGDFNDVPVSYTYHKISDGLQDAFIEKGSGLSATYSNKLSVFRIDYALFDPAFKINSYQVVRKELSDHYPVVVTFNP